MTCSVATCDSATVGRGLCDMHYRRVKRTGSTDIQPRVRATCTVDGCVGSAEGRGYCHLHYTRWRRTGTPDDPIVRTRGCSVDGCVAAYMCKGFCKKHYWRWRIHGDALYVAPEPNFRGDNVGYAGVHHRLRKELGHASTHTCPCGATAAEWAYDHNDPGERDHKGMPYSIRAEHYSPMCKKCHNEFDRTAKAQLSA